MLQKSSTYSKKAAPDAAVTAGNQETTPAGIFLNFRVILVVDMN